MATLELIPLTGTLGAEVRGLDLGARANEETIAAIRAALLSFRVLFFRAQRLDAAQLVAFGSRFGPLTPAHPITPGLDGHPEVLVVDSELRSDRVRRRDRAAGDSKWHTDVTFVATPPLGSLLHAQVIPQRGGDTQWADLVDAYATLSPALQRLVDGLEAVHDARRAFGYVVLDDRKDGAQQRLAGLRPVAHPVVRVHPETGERALFVNPTFTSHIVGLTPNESATVLGLLYEHMAQAERVVRWRWQVGDLAFWDNRATAHYAVLDYHDEPRRLHRVTVQGDRPVGPAAFDNEVWRAQALEAHGLGAPA